MHVQSKLSFANAQEKHKKCGLCRQVVTEAGLTVPVSCTLHGPCFKSRFRTCLSEGDGKIAIEEINNHN